jgi:hypothetical protein
MGLHHHVPAKRLTKAYFRRWWYWKGVSKSRLEQRHTVTELGVDLTSVPSVGGLPRFMFGSAIRDAAAWLRAAMTRDPVERVRREMMLCYFAGYLKGVRGSDHDRRTSAAPISGTAVTPGTATPSLHL